MLKKVKPLNLFITLLLVIVVAHTIFSLSFLTGGISGLSVRNQLPSEEGSVFFSPPSATSFIFLILEWTVLIGAFLFGYAQYKTELKKEYLDLNAIKNRKFTGNVTDIDKLYEFLKEKKSLRVATVSKVFNVDKSLVEEWAKTLESSDFATITYPRMGSPKITINSKRAEGNNEKEI